MVRSLSPFPQYSILQISARTILNCGQKTEDGWRFCFDTNDETSRSAIRKTMQDDCAMFHQLLRLTADDPDPVSADPEDKLMDALVYLDFTGIFDRRAVGLVKQLPGAGGGQQRGAGQRGDRPGI